MHESKTRAKEITSSGEKPNEDSSAWSSSFLPLLGKIVTVCNKA